MIPFDQQADVIEQSILDLDLELESIDGTPVLLERNPGMRSKRRETLQDAFIRVDAQVKRMERIEAHLARARLELEQRHVS